MPSCGIGSPVLYGDFVIFHESWVWMNKIKLGAAVMAAAVCLCGCGGTAEITDQTRGSVGAGTEVLAETDNLESADSGAADSAPSAQETDGTAPESTEGADQPAVDGSQTEAPEASQPASSSDTGGQGSGGLETEAVIGTLQEATGYPWADVYIVIMNTILTKPDAHTGTPSFALLSWNDREEPVLVAGYQDDPSAEDYFIYSFSGDVLIEVEHLQGDLAVSASDRRILCTAADGSQAMYQYQDDHLVKLKSGVYSTEGFQPLALTSLRETVVTSETIRSYIQ